MSAPAPAAGAPPAEFSVTADLVRQLLQTQHPDLAGLPLVEFSSGWDNVMYRLGDDYLVRLPRRQIAVPLLTHEQVWLSQLTELPLPIPAPLRIGQPAHGYPCAWSVLPWIDGQTADVCRPDPAQWPAWVAFLQALHQPAPADIPANDYRGVNLATRADAIEARLQRLELETDWVTAAVRAAWSDGLSAPMSGSPKLLHGDLHPQNILVKDGCFSGVIDWGDITGGDVATDLASLWMLFDEPELIRQALTAYAADPDLVVRARGWAVMFGAVLADSGRVNHPQHAAVGRTTLATISAEVLARRPH